MDIAMPREDFEQFLVCASKELPNNLELITFKNNKKYRYYLPRIINKKYENRPISSIICGKGKKVLPFVYRASR